MTCSGAEGLLADVHGHTTHGTDYNYDQDVPVVLFGAGIKAGRYWGAATPADLAPTLAAICGITMARTDGRVPVRSARLAHRQAAAADERAAIEEPPSPQPLSLKGEGSHF